MSTPPTPSTVSIARRICLSAISVSSRTGRSPLTASVMTGSLSGSALATVGGRTFGGSLRIACDTFSRTSSEASPMSALQDERDDDVGAAFGDHRAHFVDAADRRDRFFERQNDLRRHFLRARARQSNTHIRPSPDRCAGTESTPRSTKLNTPSTTRNRISMNAKTGR